jgi:hypothetical protein
MPTGGMIVAGVGAVAGPIIGGIMGGKQQKKAQAAAEAALAQARAIIEQVGAPPDLSAKIIMEEFRKVGIYTPELEEAVNLQASKVSQIQEDKALRDTQVKALQEISKRGRAGLTPEERAQFNLSRGEVQRDLEAKNQQIVQNLAMRGQAGGGAEIAARLLSSQESADRASEEADRINAAASARALSAISQSGELSGNLRTQDFNVENIKASSADEFDRFNVSNQIARQTRNVGSLNEAQSTNLAESQRIADTNIRQENAERQRMEQAKRDYWQDKLSYAQARANPFSQQANSALISGQGRAQSAQSIGSGIGSAFGSLATFLNKKKDDVDPDAMKLKNKGVF